ncbi:ArsR/SmtB family transcription factor [Streptomyces sp. NPDC002643]
MLRIHFGPEDLARLQMAASPDPLWDITHSLHRLQTRTGRWAYAPWYRDTRAALAGTPLGTAVRKLLLPVLPRAAYFPDFLTPHAGGETLDDGLSAVLDTPPAQIRHETEKLRRVVGAPAWVTRLAEPGPLKELTSVLRAYYEAVIAPHHDTIQAHIDSERALRTRAFLDGGVDGLLTGLAPGIRWRPPVLEVDYSEDRDLHLDGRGLRLVPSYFCWRGPNSLANPDLPPVLLYPLLHTPAHAPAHAADDDAPLATLLGRTRAAVLRVLAGGATTSELARILGISPGTATHHTTVLRDAGLVTSRRNANTVLHTLTPTGAALLGRHRNRPDQRLSTPMESHGAASAATAIVA